MFPRCLAEGPFSLGGDPSPTSTTSSSAGSSSESSSNADPAAAGCPALSVCMTLAEDGSLGEVVQLGPSRVRVGHQLSYDVVDEDLGLGPGLCQYEDLQLLYEAARLRCGREGITDGGSLLRGRDART